ncbi:response regulator [Halonotius sp. F2-221B]|uniref:response regulator n=1 Tax=Halonotius sp. F2-221B TaxID=2731620 RepID=UPI00398A9F46
MIDLSSTTQTKAIHPLHADDEPDFVRMVTKNLGGKHDRVTVARATDIHEVADIVADRTVDCVISDHRMLEKTGLDVLDDVHGVDPHLPIRSTDSGSGSIATEAISAGGSDDVITHRIREQYTLLANTVATHVDRRALRGHRRCTHITEPVDHTAPKQSKSSPGDGVTGTLRRPRHRWRRQRRFG